MLPVGNVRNADVEFANYGSEERRAKFVSALLASVTTVCITQPLNGPPSPMHRNTDHRTDHPPSHRHQILVVDDDPLFRSLMVSVLRQDFTVAVASDGADGFYRALDQVPDAAVLDIQMPGWDGIKTLKAFRSHPTLAQVKVVVLTSDASRETVLAAIQAGADDYIIKTAFSRDEFRQKLDRLLQDQPSLEIPVDAEISETFAAAPIRDDLDPTRELVGATTTSTRHVGWAGSEDLLQEAIDAWE